MRRKNLPVLVTGIVLAVAAVVAFAASAAARRTTSPHATSATAAAKQKPGVSQGTGPSTSQGTGPGGLMTPVSASIGLRPGAISPSAAGIATAEAVLPKLTVLQLAGQRVIYSYTGLTPPPQLIDLIKHGQAAGVIFFKDNVGTVTHLKAVVSELQRANASLTNPVRTLPLLLMTDQEGGIVRRLPGPPTLSAKQIGASAHPWFEATKAGDTGGAYLRGIGLNVNLAPVLDVFRTPGNFIDQFGRSFSSDPVKVEKLGELYATAEQKRRVAATVKHFPGLGAAARLQNTDEGPVTLNVPLDKIRSVDERPYKAAVAIRAKLAMVSWAIYPALDKTHPAGLSSTIVRGELRRRLGFAGVTITDALEAGALKNFGSIANRAKLAARAGMDLILCSERHYIEGVTARNALRSDYLVSGPTAQANFKAAAERVLALRATLR